MGVIQLIMFKKFLDNLKIQAKRVLTWFKTHFELWFTLLIGVAFVTLLLLGPILKIITIYPGDAPSTQNRLYLLSAAAQSLAAILALVVTMSLVAVQLASQTFTPHVMRLKLKDFYFWLLIGIYIFTILWTLWVMGWLRLLHWHPVADAWVMDVNFLFIGVCLLFLIPYTYETINGLKPGMIVKKLLKTRDAQAVEETLHRAVTEGFLTIVEEVAKLVDRYTEKKMKQAEEKEEARLKIARRTAACYRNVAKRAFRQNELDSF